VAYLGVKGVIDKDACAWLVGSDLAAFGGLKLTEWLGKAKAEGNGGGPQ
jgi:hypothetical protein